MFEAICPPPTNARVIEGEARSKCSISEHQFQVAAAQQVSTELVQQQVRALLENRIVVGFNTSNHLRALGISLPSAMVRDIQQRFNARRCSEPDLSGSDLPALIEDTNPVHSLQSLAQCILGRSVQEGPHNVLVDARATMDLYLRERGRIEQ